MEPTSSNNDVFSTAFSALVTPFGATMVVLGLLLTIAALISRGWRWGIFALAIWMTTFELAATDPESTTMGRLWGPLEFIRDNGRLLAAGAMMALFLPALFSTRGWRVRLMSGAAIAFLALELVYSGRLLVASMPTRAFTSVGVFLLIFLVLSRGVSCWLQDPAHAVAALRSVALAGVIFVAANALQLLINPSSTIWNSRLNGTAGNPQHMAMDMAVFLPAILFLMLRREEPKAIRTCLAGTVGLMVIMLGMTASRTGALMVLVAVVVMFRHWLGQFLKLAIVACVVTFLAMLVFPDAPIQTNRFMSTENTRGAVWTQLMSDFESHPLMGIVYTEPGIRESSYLSVAARLGIAGVVPLATMVYLGFRGVRLLRRARPLLGEYAMISDVVVAGMTSLAVGAVSEGFVLGTLTLQVYMIYLYLSLTTFLVDFAAQNSNLEASYEESYQAPVEEFYLGAYDL